MPNKNNHLIQAFELLQQQGDNCVMATIIETFGSTYQKAGARLIITRQEELLGLLGGGCFERDLVEHAREVFATGEAKTVFYDMRSDADAVWGLGLGCNGAVRILLELLTAKTNFTPLDRLADTAKGFTTAILVTVYESTHPDYPAGSHYLWSGAESANKPSPAVIPFPFIGAAHRTLQSKKPHAETHVINDRQIKIFADLLLPLSRLLIIGAGVDAVPLLQIAKSLGWHVTVVDYRPALVVREAFQSADEALCLLPEEISAKVKLDIFSAVVLMTHNFDYDQRYLSIIAATPIPYIGLLGPAQRRDRLLSGLGQLAETIQAQVFGPAGLDIGAKTPDEIALSIMAGIHAALKGKNGQPLSPEILLDSAERVHS